MADLHPDETVVPGLVPFEDALEIVERLAGAFPHVELSAIDRTGEKPYWF